jgi:hypothetical protein
MNFRDFFFKITIVLFIICNTNCMQYNITQKKSGRNLDEKICKKNQLGNTDQLFVWKSYFG